MTIDDSLLRDERGSRSSMRVLLYFVAMPALVLMTLCEATKVHEFQATVWTVWSGVVGLLIAGCFGPRVAQHLGPVLGQLVNAVGQAKRDPRLPSRTDDERGVVQ